MYWSNSESTIQHEWNENGSKTLLGGFDFFQINWLFLQTKRFIIITKFTEINQRSRQALTHCINTSFFMCLRTDSALHTLWNLIEFQSKQNGWKQFDNSLSIPLLPYSNSRYFIIWFLGLKKYFASFLIRCIHICCCRKSFVTHFHN